MTGTTIDERNLTAPLPDSITRLFESGSFLFGTESAMRVGEAAQVAIESPVTTEAFNGRVALQISMVPCLHHLSAAIQLHDHVNEGLVSHKFKWTEVSALTDFFGERHMPSRMDCGFLLIGDRTSMTRFELVTLGRQAVTERQAKSTVKQPEALALLKRWVADKGDEAQEAAELAELKAALDEGRIGSRKLFD